MARNALIPRGAFSKRRSQQLRTMFQEKKQASGLQSGQGPTQKGIARSVILGDGMRSRIVPEEYC